MNKKAVFKKDFYQIFQFSQQDKEINNRDIPLDRSLIKRDNFNPYNKNIILKKDKIDTDSFIIQNMKKTNTNICKSYIKDDTLNYLYDNPILIKQYKLDKNFNTEQNEVLKKDYLPEIKLNSSSKKNCIFVDKSMDKINIKKYKRLSNISNKSYDLTNASNNNIKIIKKTASLIDKQNKSINMSPLKNEKSFDIIIQKSENTSNSKFSIIRENEIFIAKSRNISPLDQKITYYENTSAKKNRSKYNNKLSINLISNTTCTDSLPLLDKSKNKFNINNFENNESITSSKLKIRNLLSEEYIKTEDINKSDIVSIEDMHFVLVRLLSKSKKIVCEEENNITTINLIEETDI